MKKKGRLRSAMDRMGGRRDGSPAHAAFSADDSLAEEAAAAPVVQTSAQAPMELAAARSESAVGFAMSEDLGMAVDVVFDVLMTQRANGSFDWSPALAALLGDDALAAARELAKTFAPAVVVTTYVLESLQRLHGSRAAEWRAAANKARIWLASQADASSVSDVISAAA